MTVHILVFAIATSQRRKKVFPKLGCLRMVRHCERDTWSQQDRESYSGVQETIYARIRTRTPAPEIEEGSYIHSQCACELAMNDEIKGISTMPSQSSTVVVTSQVKSPLAQVFEPSSQLAIAVYSLLALGFQVVSSCKPQSLLLLIFFFYLSAIYLAVLYLHACCDFNICLLLFFLLLLFCLLSSMQCHTSYTQYKHSYS